MSWFFDRKPYVTTEISSTCIDNIMARDLRSKATVYDENYLCLEFQDMKDFIYRFYDKNLFGVAYHSNSDEFPDCDDFAHIAYSGILRGAIKDRMRYPPCFGIISYSKKSGGAHCLNWLITRTSDNLQYRLDFFEPQNGKYSNDFSDVKSVMEIVI